MTIVISEYLNRLFTKNRNRCFIVIMIRLSNNTNSFDLMYMNCFLSYKQVSGGLGSGIDLDGCVQVNITFLQVKHMLKHDHIAVH